MKFCYPISLGSSVDIESAGDRVFSEISTLPWKWTVGQTHLEGAKTIRNNSNNAAEVIRLSRSSISCCAWLTRRQLKGC